MAHLATRVEGQWFPLCATNVEYLGALTGAYLTQREDRVTCNKCLKLLTEGR
jgi:hypothetical protein